MKKLLVACFILIQTLGIQSQNITLEDSLKLFIKFDGSISDFSSNQHLLQFNPNPLQFEKNFCDDSSLTFDGVSRLQSTNSFDNSNFSSTAISFWVKTTGVSSSNQMLVQGGNMGFAVYIRPNSGNVATFYDGSSSNSVTTNFQVNDGNWHHIVAQSNGATTSLYINGIFRGNRNESMNTGNGSSNNKLYIGDQVLGVGNFTGNLNNLRIYNRTLSTSEILELYDLENFQDDLKARFNFDGDLTDASGNSQDLGNTSTTVYGIFANNDQSVVFNGSTMLSSQNSFDNSNFTSASISLWFNTATTNVEQTLLQGANMGFGILINTSNKIAGFYRTPSSAALASPQVVTDGNWHHLALTNDNATTSMFLDGQLVAAKNEVMMNGNGGSNNKLYLGRSLITPRPYTGMLNDVRIYDRKLTACEIDSLSNYPTITSVESNQIQPEKLKLYPNPTMKDFNIELGKNYLGSTLQLKNISGQLISEQSVIKTGSQTLSIQGPSGIYFIQLISPEGNRITSKIVKQ